MYRSGSVARDVFYRVNQCGLKLYSGNVTTRNVTVWKCTNDPIIQMGWTSRDLADVSVVGLRVIHTRYNSRPNDYVLQAIIGTSPFYSSTPGKQVQPNACNPVRKDQRHRVRGPVSGADARHAAAKLPADYPPRSLPRWSIDWCDRSRAGRGEGHRG
jgi:hypothetical protein